MQLPGRLSRSTLGDLLGELFRHRTTGRLELCELSSSSGQAVVGRRHRIHLSAGLVIAVETAADIPPLGEILRQQGLVPQETLARLLRRLASGDDRLAGEILIGEGLVAREVVEAALRAQLRLKLEALFRLGDATLTFSTARPLAASRLGGGPLSPSDFLHHRPRTRDRLGSSGPASTRRALDEAEVEPPKSGYSARTKTPSSPPDHVRTTALRTLGLPAYAPADEVRRAFRRLATELHPDRFGAESTEERERRARLFSRVTAAYHVLVA